MIGIRYPSEYINFLLSIQLVRDHHLLLTAEDDQSQGTTTTGGRNQNSMMMNNNSLMMIDNQLSSQRNSQQKVATRRNSHNIIVRMGLSSKSNSNANILVGKGELQQGVMGHRKLDVVYRFDVIGTNYRSENLSSTWDKHFHQSQYHQKVLLDHETRESDSERSSQAVISFFLPLRHATDIKHGLSFFSQLCKKVHNLELYSSDVAVVSLRYLWSSIGMKTHMEQMYSYFSFLLVFLVTSYLYQFHWSHEQDNVLWDVIVNGMMIVTIIIMSIYLIQEYRQIRFRFLQRLKLRLEEREQYKDEKMSNFSYFRFRAVIGYRNLKAHFYRDYWNVLDVISNISGIAGFGIALSKQQHDDRVSRCLIAVTAIALWFKILYYLRPFHNSGPLGK